MTTPAHPITLNHKKPISILKYMISTIASDHVLQYGYRLFDIHTEVHDQHNRFCHQRRIKYGIGTDSFDIKRHEKNTHYRPVENRTNNIHQLNQIFKSCPQRGEKYR